MRKEKPGVAGLQGPQQPGQLLRFRLAIKQGAREGHAFRLVMGGADAGMEAPMPGASTWPWWA